MLSPLFASMPFSAGNLQGTTLCYSDVMRLKWGFAKSQVNGSSTGTCMS